MPTLAVQCERPASYELLTHDHPATNRAMDQDYSGLPTPWQWLKDAKPEPGQHCEWVALGPCWSGTGQGEWTEIDTSVNPDEQFWSAPGRGRVIVKGFRDEQGIAVYDPTITAWRPRSTPVHDLNFASIEPTTLAESDWTFTRATPAPGVKINEARYWPERLSADDLVSLTQ